MEHTQNSTQLVAATAAMNNKGRTSKVSVTTNTSLNNNKAKNQKKKINKSDTTNSKVKCSIVIYIAET